VSDPRLLSDEEDGMKVDARVVFKLDSPNSFVSLEVKDAPLEGFSEFLTLVEFALSKGGDTDAETAPPPG
jgi:hypothetical protein